MNRETVLSILCCLAIGYLLGNFSFAFVMGKLKGLDLRKSGSGNVGASNTMLMVGKFAGFIAALADIGKAAAAWWAAALLFPQMRLAGVLGGTACIIGHMYPALLRFKGGKGLACLGGVILAYNPKTFLLMLGIALFIAVVTNYICVVTCSIAVIWPAYYWLATASWLGAAVLALPALPIILKHLENFRRIKDGQELRLSYLWDREAELIRIGREDEI